MKIEELQNQNKKEPVQWIIRVPQELDEKYHELCRTKGKIQKTKLMIALLKEFLESN